MTRWRRLSRREPTEREIHDSQGMLIVCSDRLDVVVMPVTMEELYVPSTETQTDVVNITVQPRTIMTPVFNMPMYARWSGEVVWWRPMPAAPGIWRRMLQWKWWVWKLSELQRGKQP